MNSKWLNVKNGTDIRGVVVENDTRNINLTEDMVSNIAKAFTVLLSRKKDKDVKDLKVAIGMDCRITSERLKDILLLEIQSAGCTVIDCGLCSTPSMFMSTVLEGYCFDGAIEITASHLPYYYNGFKFFTNEGGFQSSDIVELLTIAEKNIFPKRDSIGRRETLNLIDIYSEFLKEKIIEGVGDEVNKLKPLRNFKIVVDAGNGAGGFFAEKVLKPLGADIDGSQFLDPDGMFPNHIPNPEKKEAMEAIKNAVLKNNADLGIIFDTDVDRAAIVDHKGNEINRNLLIALASAIILEEYPSSIIVTDSVTSNGLKKFIEELGGVHHRFKRGYKNIINEAIRFNEEGEECHFAIETSGHAALKENYFLDDGAYLVVKILIKMAQLRKQGESKISDLISELEVPYESVEYRMKINSEDFKEYGISILNDLRDYVESVDGWNIEKNNYEGIRVNCDAENGDGWFLLRLSLHEPLLPMNVESNIEGGVDSIINNLIEFFIQYDKLDFNALNK